MNSYFKIVDNGKNYRFLKTTQNVSMMSESTIGIDGQNLLEYYYPGEEANKNLYYPDVLYYFVHTHKKISAKDKAWVQTKCQEIAMMAQELNNNYVFIEESAEYIKEDLFGQAGAFEHYFYDSYPDIVKGERMMLESYRLYKSISESYEEINKKLKKKYDIKSSSPIAYRSDYKIKKKYAEPICLKDYNTKHKLLAYWKDSTTYFLKIGPILDADNTYFSSRVVEYNNETLNQNLFDSFGKKVLDKEGAHYYPMLLESKDYEHFKLKLLGEAEKATDFSNLQDLVSYPDEESAYKKLQGVYSMEPCVLIVKNGYISGFKTKRKETFQDGLDELGVLAERAMIDKSLNNQKNVIKNTVTDENVPPPDKTFKI